MAYYAELDANNKVMQVFVGKDESDASRNWETYYARPGLTVKRTSYNTQAGVHYNPDTGKRSKDQSKAFRGNYAGIGYKYDEALDAFIPPQPFPSWTIDEGTFSWVAPVAYPGDGGEYTWDEDNGVWVEVEDGVV